MKSRPVNYFPPALLELVEVDEYLLRVQVSVGRKGLEWKKQGYENGAYVAKAFRSRIVEIRKSYAKEIEALSRDIPIVRSALGVMHIGYLDFLRLAVRIDIFKAENPAKLWRYCGYGLAGKKVPDRILTTNVRKGPKYSGRARRAAGRITIRLLHRNSPYRREYDAYVARQLKDGIHIIGAVSRGRRYVIKLWLKHLWRVWRRLEGLPFRDAHPDDKTRFASDYGWL